MQVISALRKAGHNVSFSMPLTTYIAKQYAPKVLVKLTAEEIWCCENYFEPERVLNRVEPDVALYCNINLFRTVRRFAKDIVHILDLYGPLQFEGLLVEAADPEAAMQDGQQMEMRCKDVVEKIRSVDYLVTVSDRQKYFWSSYCSLAGFSFRDLNVLVCPASFETTPVTRKVAKHLTVVYSGGFYPWQNPNRFLLAAAEMLSEIDNATLHIFGGPHAGLPNESEVLLFLQDLQKRPCVKYHGYRPVEELLETLSTAWCALELMDRNLERELAITGRTVEFLASGTPVIYNDYSSLSALIEKYNAGWIVSTTDASSLRPILTELASGGLKMVDELSRNARSLAASEFDPDKCMKPLVSLCDAPLPKRERAAKMKAKIAHVLAISPDSGPLRELRVNNPLQSLLRQGDIGGLTTSGVFFEKLKGDQTLYDAVVIQRTVPAYIYQTLENLGIPFVLDVDDNLLARASYRMSGVEFALVDGLRRASGLTTPNPLTIRLLEKYSGTPLAQKAFITPNGLPFPLGAKEPSQPSQIIWIQSDIAALANSRNDVVRAVEDFSRRRNLPIILIGKNVLERPTFTNQVVLGHMDFTANLQLLELAPTSIGVAPLELTADQETLDFVAGKSDLKMLLFGGYGHPGVYSAAPPYTDSALQFCGSLVGNSYKEWTESLEHQFTEGWRAASDHQARIVSARHIDHVAESWVPVLRACALQKPVRGADLFKAFSSCQSMDTGCASAIGYLLANEDVRLNYLGTTGRSAWDHYVEHGHAEHRPVSHRLDAHQQFLSNLDRECATLFERGSSASQNQRPSLNVHDIQLALQSLQREVLAMRNSNSWKITAPLRRLAKPYMERNKKSSRSL